MRKYQTLLNITVNINITDIYVNNICRYLTTYITPGRN